MARTVAIGAQDFRKIRENNYFYVDKTSFIKEWWENGDDATLITRPRRFGKTLTMSMLDNFFSLKYAGGGGLFEGLSIWEDEKYKNLQGTYPVILLSFAGIKKETYQKTCREICRLITREYRKHAFLAQAECLLQAEKAEFLRMITDGIQPDDLESSINQLAEYLYRFYGKKVIILLDEYDAPMQEAYVNGYWDEMAAFIRGFFNATFKTNFFLERGLMTGITRVSKESIFSDLNNLEVVTTTSRKYEASFGFTADEVFDALKEFGLEQKKQEVSKWYDGFRFGIHSSIYNPWSIINFLDKRIFMNYWANSSSNKLVSSLIQKGSKNMKMAMEQLLMGNTFRTFVDEEIVFNQLDHNESAVWSLFLAGGYLKVAGSVQNKRGKTDYLLSLTNLEVKNIFEDMFIGWFAWEGFDIGSFSDALILGNIDFMNEYLNEIMYATLSCYDTGKESAKSRVHENFYHGFVLGLTADLRNRYVITSNRESGSGRYDVMLKPRNGKDSGLILEFKVFDPDKEKSLQDTVKSALRQIIEKGYAASLKEEGFDLGQIRIYGFAFSGNKVLIDGGCILEEYGAGRTTEYVYDC